MNSALRDNLLELDLHAHGGGSGSGTAALGNLVSVTMIDAAAVAAPGGTLSVIFTSATAAFIRSGGGAARELTDINHEHAIAVNATTTAGTLGSIVGADNILVMDKTVSDDAWQDLVQATLEASGTGSRKIIIAGAGVFMGRSGTVAGRARVVFNGTILPSATWTIADEVSTAIIVGTISAALSSGTYTATFQARGATTAGTSLAAVSAGLIMYETKEN